MFLILVFGRTIHPFLLFIIWLFDYYLIIWLLLRNVCLKWLAYTSAFFGKSGKDRQGNVFTKRNVLTKRPTYWAKLSRVFSSIFVYELYLILNFAST